MRDRYSLVVGLLFLAVIVVATVNTIDGGGGGETLGLDELPARWPLPEFAVPEGAGKLEGDANVAQDDCETSAIPCPEEARNAPRLPGRAGRIDPRLRLLRAPAGDLVLVHRGGGDCVEQQDLVDDAFRRYRGQVGFLSLDIRDDRDTVRELIRQRGWEMPVGYDRDGAVASLYSVGRCPTFAYVYPGGTLQSASIGELTAAQLERPGRAPARAPPPRGGTGMR